MKKFLIVILFVFTFSILSFNYIIDNQCSPVIADSGFDTGYDDYDSPSWDDSDYDGSYWDDDDDYRDNDYNRNDSNYSGEPVDPEIVLLALLICATPFLISLAIKKAISKYKNNKHRKLAINNLINKNFQMQIGDGRNNELIVDAYFKYVAIQEAWMKRDLSPIKSILTDEMYNMYQMQVETLIEDHQINVMSNFNFVCGKIKSINRQNDMEIVSVILCVNCKDYIKEESGKIISGNKNTSLTYVYELTFVRTINANKTVNCPSCGALVDNQMSAKCSHCGNTLLLTSSNLTLANKTILYKFKD